ncbi:MAG TPA: tetraacyldisaccharide 4'-kinase [Kaistella chaponensis]|jgi:tetraacyldisaccharide 4'-kinase|uniref:Tetraacyldisaccharide 4'-kinase n=1 Tax=Kaistella chaponensis TaxID=713588 RepID=A0A1N7JMB4_9FLAO|nr:tetraacyldisaccharide 4'-kinase [Kaistella chaponensis]SIS50411.1 lipid-A-disaccharide kinase [Kaistella chaponensis]HPW89151.1 tetraacyldisaccharide 4'-kinase [Kaistella chaponensis]HQC06656.1 tetraacyldisaccharide 4'-kinase [Kaistella chaponensis]
MKRWYLYPFSLVYHFATSLRNLMYDWGILKSTSFKTPIINVGNLSVGGSGKSPMVMYLAEFLCKTYKTGVLSRGYGRQTKGYGITNYDSNYKTVGDEAMQLFERFKNKFVIGVSEARVPGAKKMIEDMDLDVLILDDAYQHRAIKPGLQILMTDYNDPYFKDYVLPAGDLRESRNGASRAQIIMVSKCPAELTAEQKQYYISRIKPRSDQKVFFSSIGYDENIYAHNQFLPDNNLSYYDILLITGIANPKPLLNHLSKFSQRVKHLKYKDHHNFSDQDFKNIIAEYKKLGEYKLILTTEKDYVRLKTFDYLRELVYYWPINVDIDKKEEFNQIILNYVSKN